MFFVGICLCVFWVTLVAGFWEVVGFILGFMLDLFTDIFSITK